ncbi:MAG: hypothetical protein AAFY20_24755 [Cyanobacteria bacterium J06639_14]
MKLSKLSLIGIGVGAIAIGGYAGTNIYASQVAEGKVKAFIDDVDEQVIVEYGKVSANPFKSDVVIKDIRIAPVETPEDVINIDKVVIRKLEDGDEFPKILDASAYGIDLSGEQAASPIFSSFLQQANYDEPPLFNLDTQYEYQESSGKVVLETLRFGADDFGYLEATFELGNVDPDVASNDALTLHAAEITYQDDSFVAKLFESMAAQSNQDVDQFKAQLQTGLTQNAQFFIASEDAVAMTALEEAKAFIENPKGFTISANPQQPVSMELLSTASNPTDWAEMLNLKIESY